MRGLLLRLPNFATHRAVIDKTSTRTGALRRSAMLLAALLLPLVSASGAQADSEGFIDNWNGDVRVELRALGLAQSGFATFPAPDPHESLRAQFNRIWSAPKARNIFCGEARTFVEELDLPSGFAAGGLICDIGRVGELRGRIAGPNRLDLKYVVTGNRFRFKIFTPPGIPALLDGEVLTEFDIELRTSIAFDTNVDGRSIPAEFERSPLLPDPIDSHDAVYLAQPAHLMAPNMRALNARVTSAQVLVNLLGSEKLRRGERQLNAFSRPLDDDELKFNIRELNRGLHRGANQFAKTIQTLRPELGFPSRSFDLAALIDDNRTFVIQYQRSGTPPQVLPGCTCSSKCNDEVSCHCAAAGIIQENDHVFLHRQKPDGTWIAAGDARTDFVDGSAFGARTGEALTYRICRLNRFGSSCTGSITFVYQAVAACPVPPSFGSQTSSRHCGGEFTNPRPCINPNPLK